MNYVISKEDVVNVIRSFCLCSEGDDATVSLLLSVGGELLNVSPDRMQELIAEVSGDK